MVFVPEGKHPQHKQTGSAHAAVSSRPFSDQYSPLHIFKLDIWNRVELVLFEIGFLVKRERMERKQGSAGSQQYSDVTSSTPTTTWRGDWGQSSAPGQGLAEVTHVEVAVHVEPHDAEVVGARDVGDDALPALPLLRHPHPHVPVPELGKGNCCLHSRLGTSLNKMAVLGPFRLPSQAPVPTAQLARAVPATSVAGYVVLKLMPIPDPSCLGILPRGSSERTRAPPRAEDDQGLQIYKDVGAEDKAPRVYSPSLGLATLAPAHPCRGSSGAPSPGPAWSPHGTGARGPQPCAHSPAMLRGAFSTLNASLPLQGRGQLAPWKHPALEEGDSHWEARGRDRMEICRGTSEWYRAGETHTG